MSLRLRCILVLTVWALPAFAIGEIGDSPSHPRASLFPGSPAVAERLEQLDRPGTLAIVFLPNPGACELANATVARVVARFLRHHGDDTRALSVVPEGWSGSGLFGVPLPGERLEVERESLADEHRRGPLPRIEVWTRKGRLLYIRSLLRFDEEDLHEDLERTRAFLEPVS